VASAPALRIAAAIAVVAGTIIGAPMSQVVPGAVHASGASATPHPSASAGAGAGVRVVAGSSDDLHARAVAIVAAMPVAQRAATVVMSTMSGTDTTALHDYMSSSGIGGFILMGDTVPATEDGLRSVTAALTVDPALPPLIATDEEGGDVARLPWDVFPSSLDLKGASAQDVARAFAGRAALVQRAGIGVDFGTIADVTPDPNAFIYRRALGTTPDAASASVQAATEAQSGEVLSTLKHFPGHGAAAGDSHTMIPSTPLSQGDWQSSDAAPFRAGIEAGAPILMFGHLAYTSVDAAPASLSATWHRIARQDLGFTGVAITDDLGMLQASGDPAYRDPVANAVAAIAAGSDMVLAIMYTTPHSAATLSQGIAAAVASGTLPASRLQDAATRVVELRLQLAASGRGLVPCTSCAPVG
jgi:beta-N-acetylhexosaminidase